MATEKEEYGVPGQWVAALGNSTTCWSRSGQYRQRRFWVGTFKVEFFFVYFFFPQIFLRFLLSFCLVIVQCLLCCFCFLCVPLFTVCTLERNLWLSDWLIQNSSNFEWYLRCVEAWIPDANSFGAGMGLFHWFYLFILSLFVTVVFLTFSTFSLHIYHGPWLPSHLANMMLARLTLRCTMDIENLSSDADVEKMFQL